MTIAHCAGLRGLIVKLGVGALYKNLGRVRIWGHSPYLRTSKNVALGYNVGKVWKVSAGCLVFQACSVVDEIPVFALCLIAWSRVK